MSATLYRIDGTHRTYTQLFPIGNGAIYDNYGVTPFTGAPRVITIGQHSTVRLNESTTVGIRQRSTVRLTQTVTVRARGRSTLQLNEE